MTFVAPPRFHMVTKVPRVSVNLDLPTGRFSAIRFNSTEKALVEANLVNLPIANPWEIFFSKPLHFQGNATPAGGLVEPSSGKTAENVSKRIEEALLMSL